MIAKVYGNVKKKDEVCTTTETITLQDSYGLSSLKCYLIQLTHFPSDPHCPFLQ